MNQYRELFRARIISAMAQARAARGITHQGLKGEIVEILIRDLFRPLLPSDIGVASGQIVSADGKHISKQTDIILYDKSIVPPILYRDDIGLIPVESVLYTVEVKTTLDAMGVRQAHEAAKLLHTFPHLSGCRDDKGKEVSHRIDQPRTVVFALSSDLTPEGMSEVERYRSIYKNEYPHLRAICIANKEYWWEDKGSWRRIPGSPDFRETLGFVGGVSNTYKWISQNRGKPNLGNYIMDTNYTTVFYPSGTQPTVSVLCEGCGATEVFAFVGPAQNVADYADGFRMEKGCQKCGGDFSAPPGKYENQEGLLVKVGEIAS